MDERDRTMVDGRRVGAHVSIEDINTNATTHTHAYTLNTQSSEARMGQPLMPSNNINTNEWKTEKKIEKRMFIIL